MKLIQFEFIKISALILLFIVCIIGTAKAEKENMSISLDKKEIELSLGESKDISLEISNNNDNLTYVGITPILTLCVGAPSVILEDDYFKLQPNDTTEIKITVTASRSLIGCDEGANDFILEIYWGANLSEDSYDFRDTCNDSKSYAVEVNYNFPQFNTIILIPIIVGVCAFVILIIFLKRRK